MRSLFLKRLEESKFILGDGAMGTMLQSLGPGPSHCPEEFNLKHPEIVKKVHQGYIAAGSEIIQTNSFGGNRIRLGHCGMADEIEEINTVAVKIAKETAKNEVFVAASVGPTGKLLEPWGDLKFQEAYQIFAEQIKILAASGADIIILETFSDLEEVRAALRAAKEETNLPVICTMTFEPSGRTVMGVTPEKAAETLQALGADVLGTNCSTGPEEMFQVIRKMRQVASGYLIAQPNAGKPQLVSDKVTYDAPPDLFAEYAQRFVDLGVKIVGGCCGTTPEHIRAMANQLRGFRSLRKFKVGK